MCFGTVLIIIKFGREVDFKAVLTGFRIEDDGIALAMRHMQFRASVLRLIGNGIHNNRDIFREAAGCADRGFQRIGCKLDRHIGVGIVIVRHITQAVGSQLFQGLAGGKGDSGAITGNPGDERRIVLVKGESNIFIGRQNKIAAISFQNHIAMIIVIIKAHACEHFCGIRRCNDKFCATVRCRNISFRLVRLIILKGCASFKLEFAVQHVPFEFNVQIGNGNVICIFGLVVVFGRNRASFITVIFNGDSLDIKGQG